MKLPTYRGLRRRLVLAFDLGTTFSGVSYAVLDPGQTPEIRGVTRFPAHEQISGASKIPTIIYYDQEGQIRAVGAEALRENTQERAEEEGWFKAEWFKLHIRPRDGSSYDIADKIPPLPQGKFAVTLFADFLRYLFQCTETYIKETHANGTELWDSLKDDIDFVLSHPNGWEGYQQSQVRRAAVAAGFIPDNKYGHDRIWFVTEGEASLHFAIQNGLPQGVMESGDGVIIVDAGGGTIDISAYRKPKYSKTFEEISTPQCHFQGSVFVSINARLYLDNLLKESEYHEDLDHIVRCFDKTTKVRFSDDQQPQYIKFGSTRDNDLNCGIRFGQLKLEGSDVATFFEPSIRSIVLSIREVLKSKSYKVSHVVLVGGFGASEWLLKRLKLEFEEDSLQVMRPELYVNKAVSDGAVAYYLSHMVTARIARYSYGTFRNIEYKPGNPDHEKRIGELLVRPSGRRLVPNSFAVMLAKGTKVSEENEAKVYMWKEADSLDQLSTVSFDVICYKGKMENPTWKDEDPLNFKKLCRVEVDLSHLQLEPQTKKDGGKYYLAKYWVILKFNSAELKAQMMWYEGTVEKRSTARLVFYQDT
ncbi:hypothetical protein CC1G_04585 [Coprinopsis cinerea okayama7|uniref:Uncharacterized protein n=1 Tax=Coprinopsis cinerea (strain Okayama-7 / 130 / ATCC MYA-4618 / FGSC 9003) TaxID=240176 RepID=A8N507_COPC7|nr:hypothetical protein CC1G_04585 [Coprinopsis cinerea okayama7\|eukprot:XP_001829896.1 hypothetical protein CC1G_04585 [Coprinopsis cinerea okayama7\